MPIYDFQQWLKLREDLAGLGGAEDPTDQFRFNKNDKTSDMGVDYENIQKEIAKLVMSKYNPVYMRFLKSLAEEHADQELMSLINKIDSDNSMPGSRNWKPRFSQKDQIVPPIADKGVDPNTND